MNTQSILPVPTPWHSLRIPVDAPQAQHQAVLDRSLQLDPTAAHEAHALKRAEWSTLTLRQTWADEAWMRAYLTSAGLRVKYSTEPATVPRLRSLLRRVGIQGPEFAAATGTNPAGYLSLNPGLPLWAAVALVLEASGTFAGATRASA